MSLSHTYYIFACNAKFVGEFAKCYLQDMSSICINSSLIYFYHLRWVAEKFISFQLDFDTLVYITCILLC